MVNDTQTVRKYIFVQSNMGHLILNQLDTLMKQNDSNSDNR